MQQLLKMVLDLALTATCLQYSTVFIAFKCCSIKALVFLSVSKKKTAITYVSSNKFSYQTFLSISHFWCFYIRQTNIMWLNLKCFDLLHDFRQQHTSIPTMVQNVGRFNTETSEVAGGWKHLCTVGRMISVGQELETEYLLLSQSITKLLFYNGKAQKTTELLPYFIL